MADIVSQEQRSKNMSAIRSKDTKPEIYIRHLLFSHGYRYRKNCSLITGCPDIYLAKYKTAIFINGCFWHRHANCKFTYTPKSRIEFWNKKFSSNISRDLVVHNQLLNDNIKCLVIWECCVKSMQKDALYEENMLTIIRNFLHSADMYMELPAKPD